MTSPDADADRIKQLFKQIRDIEDNELTKDKPNWRLVYLTGMDGVRYFTEKNHKWAAYFVVAQAHEGMRDWESAYRYWDFCRELEPKWWTPEYEARLVACLERYQAKERARKGTFP